MAKPSTMYNKQEHVNRTRFESAIDRYGPVSVTREDIIANLKARQFFEVPKMEGGIVYHKYVQNDKQDRNFFVIIPHEDATIMRQFLNARMVSEEILKKLEKYIPNINSYVSFTLVGFANHKMDENINYKKVFDQNFNYRDASSEVSRMNPVIYNEFTQEIVFKNAKVPTNLYDFTRKVIIKDVLGKAMLKKKVKD